MRRNSCRAASLSQFLWGGAFWKKPLSRYLLRLRLVLRRAGGNGGLGDVVRMIADVLDDPENIHIDKARFGVAFLLVQPLDVAVAEFDFEAAQLPGDGGDFARLVGVVVDEAVQRGHNGVMGFGVHAGEFRHGLLGEILRPVLAVRVVLKELLAVVADALDVPGAGDIQRQHAGRVIGDPGLHDVFGIGFDGLVQLVDFGFGLFDLGDEVFLVVEEYFLNRIKKVDDQKAHVGTFVFDRFHSDAGGGFDELGIKILGPFDDLMGLVGQEPADERRERLDEGQEDDGVEDVEQRMGVGDLVGDARSRHGDQLLVKRKDGEENAYANDVEEHMGGTGLFGGPIRADGSEDRGDGCSDIVTQDDGDGRVEGQEALYAEGDGQADRSGAGLDKEGKQRSGQNPHERVVAEHEE